MLKLSTIYKVEMNVSQTNKQQRSHFTVCYYSDSLK